MTPDNVIEIFKEALFGALWGICILVLPALAVGLLVSVFQAATQINEMTLSFLPKLFVVVIVVVMFVPMLLQHLAEFTQHLLMNIPAIVG